MREKTSKLLKKISRSLGVHALIKAPGSLLSVKFLSKLCLAFLHRLCRSIKSATFYSFTFCKDTEAFVTCISINIFFIQVDNLS